MFLSKYGASDCIAYHSKNMWYMDIAYVNALQLKHAGVKDAHIEVPVFCTSCQSDMFYSYRKDTKETFGEIMGVITRSN
jgi:polyphenol oxidase